MAMGHPEAEGKVRMLADAKCELTKAGEPFTHHPLESGVPVG